MGIIRKTKSVEIILNEFSNRGSAISVIELIENLKNDINKTTVYRVLDRLEDDGVVHSFLGNSGIKWYAMCKGCSSHNHTDFHPHFQCLDCGDVECLTVDIDIPKIPNKRIEASQILLQGKCANCA